MKYTIGIVVVILIGAYLFFTNKPVNPAPEPANSSATTARMNTGASTTPLNAGQIGATVTLTASGYSPATITIKQGQSVTFVDQNGSPMWVTSNPHPTHTAYDGTSEQTHCAAGYTGPAPFDECVATTNKFTFTFTKIGTWGYHDHRSPETGGTVVVIP